MRRPCPRGTESITLSEIAPSHFPLQNKPNYINVQYRTSATRHRRVLPPKAFASDLRGGSPETLLKSDPAQIMRRVLVVGDEEETGLIVKSGF